MCPIVLGKKEAILDHRKSSFDIRDTTQAPGSIKYEVRMSTVSTGQLCEKSGCEGHGHGPECNEMRTP